MLLLTPVVRAVSLALSAVATDSYGSASAAALASLTLHPKADVAEDKTPKYLHIKEWKSCYSQPGKVFERMFKDGAGAGMRSVLLCAACCCRRRRFWRFPFFHSPLLFYINPLSNSARVRPPAIPASAPCYR